MNSPATRAAIRKQRTQEEIVHAIAREIRGLTNRVAANDTAPPTYRMRKSDRQALLHKIDGMKIALGLALGAGLIPADQVDDYLQALRREVLDQRALAPRSGAADQCTT